MPRDDGGVTGEVDSSVPGVHRGDAENAEERRVMELSSSEINERTGQIVDAAMKVHNFLGPGLLESTYEACLAHELKLRGLAISTQFEIPLVYEGLRLEVGYRADLLVENSIVVELKAVEKLIPVHEAQ